LNAVFRSFHTIKGGAGFMNLQPMVSACHLTENLFDALRNGQVPVTPIAIEAALEASGFVADQLGALANGAQPDSLPASPAELECMLSRALEGAAAAGATSTAPTASVAPATATRSSHGPEGNALYQAVGPAGTAVPATPAAPEPAGAATVAPAASAAAA